MSILSGFFKTKKYRKTDTGYQLQSEWTSASTVEMADGNTAETNLGAIQGITDSLTATSSNVALSAKAGSNLQGQIDDVNSNLSNVAQSGADDFTDVSVSGKTVTFTRNDGTTKAITTQDTNTTYSAGTGLSLNGTTFNHNTSVTPGSIGTSDATSGKSLDVPWLERDAQGHVIGSGTHTHTVSGFFSEVGLKTITCPLIPIGAGGLTRVGTEHGLTASKIVSLSSFVDGDPMCGVIHCWIDGDNVRFNVSNYGTSSTTVTVGVDIRYLS